MLVHPVHKLHEAFDGWLRRDAGRPWLFLPDGEMSFGELGRQVQALEAELRDARVRRGDRVLVRESLSTVKMKRLSDTELNAYLASGEWQGKAGGYGIQGLAGALIPWISGSFTGIMGLPVAETAALLTAIGYPVWRQE